MPVWKFDFNLLCQPYNNPWVPSMSSSLPLPAPLPIFSRSSLGPRQNLVLHPEDIFPFHPHLLYQLHLELARALLLSYSCLLLPSPYHGQKEDQYEKKYIAHLLFAFTVGYRCPQNVVPWGCSSVGRVLNWQAGSPSSVPLSAQTGYGGGHLQSHQQDMEKGSEVPSHLWLCSQFKASLDYIQVCLKDRCKTKQRRFPGITCKISLLNWAQSQTLGTESTLNISPWCTHCVCAPICMCVYWCVQVCALTCVCICVLFPGSPSGANKHQSLFSKCRP